MGEWGAMVKTHLILDGLQDMGHGGELSRRWFEAGFLNGVDVAGQCGWVSRREDWDWGAVEAGYLHEGGDMTSKIAAEVEKAEREGSTYGYWVWEERWEDGAGYWWGPRKFGRRWA